MKLGDYEIIRPIASGGMGAVFEVEHRGTRARYAAKVVKNAGDARARERFRREAELLARVDRHPGIVRIHSFGETPEGGLYMIMDLVRGESLETKLEREGKLAPHRAAALARSVAVALGAAHALGVVHRDVKPANILVDAASGEPRLADFGIAAARDLERLTKTGAFVGTVAYVAPEQARGEPASPASDVFSLGAVLFEMLAGHPPILGATPVQLLSQLVSDEPIPDVRTVRPEVPAPLAAVVGRALEKDPARRPADGEALAAELDLFLAGLGAKPSRRARPRRALLAAAAALVLALALGLALLHGAGGDAGDASASRLAALEALARGDEGTSDALALLAARAAHAVAALDGRSVSWETDAAGARAALALGAGDAAVDLSRRALERAPADRRDELRLLHARARLVAEDTAAALSELRALDSSGAFRLRARLLLEAGSWKELEGLEAGDPFVRAARALAEAHRGQDAASRRQAVEKIGGEEEVACALLALEAQGEMERAVPVLDLNAEGLDGLLRATQVSLHERVDAMNAACEKLRKAFRQPRWIDRAALLATIERALDYLARMFGAAPALPQEATRIGSFLDALAASCAGSEPLRALTARIHAEELLGGRGEDDPGRVAFLEASIGKGGPAADALLARLLAQREAEAYAAGSVSTEDALRRCEELLPRMRPREGRFKDVGERSVAEAATCDLCLRLASEQPADRESLLARAASHLERARSVPGLTAAEERLVERVAVELALARDDLAEAEKIISGWQRAVGAQELLLHAEVLRLRGKLSEAHALLEQVDPRLLSWQTGDLELSGWLVEVQQGRDGAAARLASAVVQRPKYPGLLPWIDRDAKKALGR